MTEQSRERAITLEGIRLFLVPDGPRGVSQVRYLHILSSIASVAISVLVWCSSGTGLAWMTLWCALTFLGETVLTLLNGRFHDRPRDEDELEVWARLKAVASSFNAATWGVGPYLLHAQGVPTSVLAPVWGIVGFLSVTMYAGAYYRWTMFGMIVTAILPAALSLWEIGGDLERSLAVCLLVALPFMLAVGMLSVRKTREAIGNRLAVSDLLDEKARQATQLKEMFDERTRFFSAASHDLRQPLQALGFYMTLLRQEVLDFNQRDLVERMSDCTATLDRQFNAILGIAQDEQAIERAEPKPMPLAPLLERIEASVRGDCADKGLSLRIAPTSLWVSAPPELLERTLMNLAANAARYTTAGGVLIGARPRGNRVELWVVDTGIGIAPEHGKRIFDDFYQVGNTERRRGKGFGLGLAIVRRLCAGLGWTLAYLSVPGRGSTFRVGVPRSEPMPLEALAPAVGSATDKEDTLAVVLVDDDDAVLDSVGRVVRSWGAEVAAFHTGDEALKFLAERDGVKRWQVLLDYRLDAGENGLAVADRIRELAPVLGTTPRIFLMTGEADPDILVQAGHRGIATLRKPVPPIRLRAALMSPYDAATAGASMLRERV